GGLNGRVQIADALRDLRHLFKSDWIIRRELSHALIDSQRLIEFPELKQSQPKAVEGFGLIGKFLQGLAIRGGGFLPILIPGRRVAFIHCFLVDVVSFGHGSILPLETTLGDTLMILHWRRKSNVNFANERITQILSLWTVNLCGDKIR